MQIATIVYAHILSYQSLIRTILAEPEERGRFAFLKGIDKLGCLTVPDGYSLYHLVNDFCCGKLTSIQFWEQRLRTGEIYGIEF